jgi:hypothetical protein
MTQVAARGEGPLKSWCLLHERGYITSRMEGRWAKGIRCLRYPLTLRADAPDLITIAMHLLYRPPADVIQ